MASTKDLIKRLDDFMVSLLDGASGVRVTTDGAAPEPVPIAEKARVFDAAVKWMGERGKIAPEEGKKEAPMGRLRNKLRGSPRGRNPATEDEEAAGGDDAADLGRSAPAGQA